MKKKITSRKKMAPLMKRFKVRTLKLKKRTHASVDMDQDD